MITVTFLNGCILATAEQSLWQYSYNQQLQINGLELPGVFTVDFCNEGDTTTVAMIGSSGVVDIPNELLTSGRDIVAYVFQKSTLTGGITRCEIRIDVLTRPERDDETPTPEQEAVIDQYIAELNEGVETAETAAANAETSENNAAASAADAQQSKADAAASASAAAGSASDASNSAAAAAQSAVNASNSAEDAAEAASEGIGYKEDSEAWAIGKRGGVDVGSSDETYHNNSKYYAGQAAASSSAANSEAAAAAQSARDAAASANGAAQSAASATASKNAAANSADIAANAATAAQNHAISAASSATAAGGSATAAANKATAAAQSATAAGNSATEAATAREAAEDAQDAAEAAAQSIAQSAAQIAQNTSDIADLKDAVDTLQPAATAADIGKALIVKTVADGKPTEYEYGEAGGGGDSTNYAPIIVNSASGDIASFADGADGLPVKALTVNVEPIQDLNGYDSPWPAGGGKNLLPPIDKASSGYNVSVVYSGNAVSVTGLANSSGGRNVFRSEYFSLPAGTYYFKRFNETSGTSPAVYIQNDTSIISADGNGMFTLSADSDKMNIGINVISGVEYNYSCVFLVSPENVNAYSPYSNICPISGRTSATVTRTGKNLFNPHLFSGGVYNPAVGTSWILTDSTVQFTTLDNKVFTITPAATWQTYTMICPLKQGESYRRHGKLKSTGMLGISEGYLDAGFNVLANFNNTNTEINLNGTLVIPSDAEYYYLLITNRGTANVTLTFTEPQIELGSTASDYEPYQGNTYDIIFPSEAGTVYGGTLDVTGGKMTVDRVEYKLLWSSGISPAVGATCTAKYLNVYEEDIFLKSGNTQGKTISDIIPYQYNNNDTPHFYLSGYDANAGRQSIRIFLPNDTDPATEIQFVLGLATPIEITLTATQISTLLGTNNIWSDAGDVDVDYRADTKLYIDNIHTPTDDDMTADAQIASGKYFLIGGTLYLSTTVIPAGDTIRPGTNCVKTNLAEALNALNA